MATETQTARPAMGTWTPKVNLPGLAFILMALLIWEVIVATGLVQLTFLPAPSAVVISWFDLLLSGQMLPDVFHTLAVSVLGFLLGSVLGLAAGIWLGISVRSWRYGMATIDFLRSIPAICFLSVATLFLGLSVEMELTVATYAALWVVLINTVEGIRRTDGIYWDTARTLQLSRFQRIFKVLLPSAAGSIVVGLRLALALALTLAVASEMIGNPAGMGYQLVMQQQALQPGKMLAYVITIGLLGMALNRLLLVVIGLANPGIIASLREDSA
jgi:sulfonate transport system permease protein